jgi:hypothetical protein
MPTPAPTPKHPRRSGVRSGSSTAADWAGFRRLAHRLAPQQIPYEDRNGYHGHKNDPEPDIEKQLQAKEDRCKHQDGQYCGGYAKTNLTPEFAHVKSRPR